MANSKKSKTADFESNPAKSVSEPFASQRSGSDAIGADVEMYKLRCEKLEKELSKFKSQQKHSVQNQDREQYATFFKCSICPVFWFEFDKPVSVDWPIEAQVDAILQHAYVKDASDSAVKIMGCRQKSELIGRRLSEVWNLQSDERHSFAFDHLSDFVRAGYKFRQSEENLISASGANIRILKSARGVVENGQLTRIWASHIDINDCLQVEAALRESEQKFRLSFAASAVGMAIIDRQGKFLSVNKAVSEVLDYPEDELLNITFMDITYPDDIDKSVKRFGQCLRDHKPYNIEKRYLTKHKKIIWGLITVSPIFNEAGEFQYAIAHLQDITNRKLAEETLKKNSVIIDSTSDAIISTDLNAIITFWNKGAEKLYGFRKEEAIGKPISIIHKPEYMHVLEPMICDILNGKEIPSLEITGLDKYGRDVDTLLSLTAIKDDAGRITEIFGITKDISEHNKAQENLREAKQRYSKIFHASPLAIAITRLKDSRFIEVNDAFLALTGLTSEQCAEVPVSQLKIYTNYREREKLVQLVRENGKVQGFEIKLQRQNGERVDLLMSAELIEIAGEECLLSLALDITMRKQADLRLKDNERKYRALFENMLNGFALHEIVLDQNKKPIDYIYREVNRAFENLTNLNKIDLIGQPVSTAVPGTKEDPADWIKVYGQVALTGKSIRFEQYSQALNKWYSVLAFSPKKHFFATVFEDITERKIAEAKLQESEQKYRSLVENSDMGIAMISPEMKILSMNRQMKEWFPRADDSGCNICYEKFNTPPRSEPCSYCPVILTLADGKVHEAITETPTPEGILNYKVVASPVTDSNGKIISVIETVEDYSVRRRAEINLQESERKFRSYVDNAPDGIFVINEKGFYIDVNDAAATITGYSREELLSMHILDLVPDYAIEIISISFKTLLQSGKTIVESPFIKKDGSTGYWNVNAVTLGENRFLGFVNDITETKRLRELESRASRLELAGTIAGQVAHDFNNLLGPIMAYPEIIRDEFPCDSMIQAYLFDIENAASKIADINQDLLTMGRRGHYNQEILNLNQSVMQAVRELEAESEKVTYELDLDENLMNIKGGDSQIHRVIINLLYNAYDAMQNKGRIAIKTENFYADDISIAYGYIPKGEYVRLTIADEGCGIPEAIREKILDPFFSTKTVDRRRGSGLGMSVVDAVLKDHNGYLDLSSEIGRGTSFYLYFPISRENIDKVEYLEWSGGNESILVVDDDKMQQSVTSTILSKLGYKVNVVESGEKAIEVLIQSSQDLLVLDMIMPEGINGVETYRLAKEINPEQKAIIVSGFSETEQVIMAKNLGLGAFIKKPLTKDSIAKAVRQELDRRVLIHN